MDNYVYFFDWRNLKNEMRKLYDSNKREILPSWLCSMISRLEQLVAN